MRALQVSLSSSLLPIRFNVASFGEGVVTLWYGFAVFQPCHFGGRVGVNEDGKLCLLQKADKLNRRNPTVVQRHEGILL